MCAEPLPRLYAHCPARPVPCSLPAIGPDTRTNPYIAVIVVIPAPLRTEDARKLEALQRLRQRWDQAFPRWVPHLTLIPPFAVPPPEKLGGSSQSIGAETLDEVEPQPSRQGERQESDLPVQPRAETFSEDAHFRSREAEPSGLVVTAHQVSSALSNVSDILTRVCSIVPELELRLNQVGTFKLREYTNVHLRPRSEPNGDPAPLTTLHTQLVDALPEYILQPEGRRKALHHGLPARTQNNLHQAFSTNSSGADIRMNRSARRRLARDELGGCTSSPQFGNQPAERTDGDSTSAGLEPKGEAQPRETASVQLELADFSEPAIVKEEKTTTCPLSAEHNPIATTEDTQFPPHVLSALGSSMTDQQDSQNTARTRGKGRRRKFQPHMSVGQARGYRQCRALERMIRENVLRGGTVEEGGVEQGVLCRVDKVYLLTKPQGKSGPYEVFKVVPLASPSMTEETEVSRSDTVGI
ncbi:hypothetical protein QFC19_001373 [Naganishia cerealis]|uniref:Uncharacterized protein n=1 Tax=Naganishia cerealis TaxID=610337 RepID=A0ACC2WI56_9TREE|nr:hypothetical protein QFC19_001373 [Naganishia cerealis]